MHWNNLGLLLDTLRVVSVQSLLIERMETIRLIAAISAERQIPAFIWNLGQKGFYEVHKSGDGVSFCKGEIVEAPEVWQAISFVQHYSGRAIFIIENLQSMMQPQSQSIDSPSSAARLRSLLVNLLGEWLAKLETDRQTTVPYLVLLGTEAVELPTDLSNAIREIWKPLPTREEITAQIEAKLSGSPLASLQSFDKNALVLAASGLSLEEINRGLTLGLRQLAIAQACGASAIASLPANRAGAVNQGSSVNENQSSTLVDFLLEYKRDRLKQTLDIDFIAKSEVKDFGGLDRLRNIFAEVKNRYTAAAKTCNLPLPKGCLLVGPPGTGKSRAVKACAYQLGFPLAILDVGIIVARGVGYLREIIRRLEALAPVVVGFDEFDKLFDTSRVGSNEATSNRQILGTLLTWFQEKKSQVYVVATLNRLLSLPPELTREGRFDHRVYVGFPQHIERKEVIQLHAARFDPRYREGDGPLNEAEWRQILNLTQNFTPAELEQMIIKSANAIFQSQYVAQPEQRISIELNLAELLKQRATIFTLFSTRTDEVLAMENQARYVCEPASSPDSSIFAPPLTTFWGQRLDQTQASNGNNVARS